MAGEPRAVCSAIMNNIIRATYKDPKVAETWTLTDHTNAVFPIKSLANQERDHFFEVQHFVDLLFINQAEPPLNEDPASPNYVYARPLGQFVALGNFLNDTRNLYKIDDDKNQMKRHIPFEDYWPSSSIRDQKPFIQSYLSCTATNGASQNSTVAKNVKDLAASMAMYPEGDPTFALVHPVGDRLCRVMKWGYIGMKAKPSLSELMKKGAFNVS